MRKKERLQLVQENVIADAQIKERLVTSDKIQETEERKRRRDEDPSGRVKIGGVC